jgi:energy-coupling factor transporter ATP-binding protein EcfA2
MAPYSRTAIRSLSIRGFRSIRSLDLDGLPDLIVLHGPNGSGKSNLLRAVRLVLGSATLPSELPVTREKSVVLSLIEADKFLDLRPDDFHIGMLEIRIKISIELGNRSIALTGFNGTLSDRITLELVIEQSSESELRYWFDKAETDSGIVLGGDDNATLRQALVLARSKRADAKRQLTELELQLSALVVQPNARQLEAQRGQLRAQIQSVRQAIQAHTETARSIEEQLGPRAFVAEYLRNTLLRQLLQVSPTYRVPGSPIDPEIALFQAFLSENVQERQATQRLGRRLAKAQLFGTSLDRIELLPVESNTYKEKQVRFKHPSGAELPLRNLGSGEQQIIFLLAQRVITPYPIAFLEEPEAHLHPSLMIPFGQVLLDSLAGAKEDPDVEQLWIATHHHLFALALEYFDVRIMAGATEVRRLPRAKAAPHYYEPGPIWEALRQLAHSAKQKESVVFRTPDGRSVTAGEILDSIEKDPRQAVATEYAQAVTEVMVRAMQRRADKPEGDK